MLEAISKHKREEMERFPPLRSLSDVCVCVCVFVFRLGSPVNVQGPDSPPAPPKKNLSLEDL